MAKSLLISEIFPPINGGSGRWFWELYTRLPRKECHLAVGKCSNYKEFDLTHDLNLTRLDLSSSLWGIKSMTGLKFYISNFFKLRKLVNEKKISSIHCGRCLPEGVFGLIFCKLYKIPYLCFIHGEDVESASTSRELSWLVSKVLKNAKTLICNSNNTANLLKTDWNITEDQISVIHPGIDTLKFKPAPESEIIKEKLGWAGKTIILTVGRLQKRKGQDMMIKALPKIKQTIPNILYAIIGNGKEKVYLQKITKQLKLEKNVLFMDEVSDEEMIQAYQQCHLFILPNRTEGRDIEGFGMVLIEAQACGKFVIAGNSGGTKETILSNKSGEIISCTNLNEIELACTSRLRSSYNSSMISNLVTNKFNWILHIQLAKVAFTKLKH